MERFNLASRLGLQFGGSRDLYEVYGYKKDLKFIDYLSKYARQDVAGRIIDAPAASTWREPPTITDESNSGFDDRWAAFLASFPNLWHYLERGDKLAGLGQYALIMIGFDDSSDVGLPVRSNANRKVLYMKPLAEDTATINKFEEDPKNPRYGLPVEYNISVGDPQRMNITKGTIASTATKELTVHYTRILHIVENPMENEVVGRPRLERVYNLLDDLAKVAGGSAETYWLTANRGMQADVDKEMDLSTDDAAALNDEIEEYQHQLRRFIRTRGVTLNTLGSDTPDPTGVFKMLISLLAGATGIPQRILLGAEAGQLASEQDRANWADRISERQINFAAPSVLIPLLNILTNAGILPEADMLKMKWGENFYMSPLETAQREANKARAAVNFSRQEMQGSVIVSIGEAREIMGLDPETIPEQPEDENENENEGGAEMDGSDDEEETDERREEETN